LRSELEGALRLDAEYYQPEYLSCLSMLKKFDYKRIGEIAKVLRGNTPSEYGNFEVPIVRSGDLSNSFIGEELLRAKDENVFWLQQKDVLISSIGFGSIGKVNIFLSKDRAGTVSEVSVIRDSKINSFYLWAFLKGKFGQFQINREITGATGQLHLNTKNVEHIIVPVIERQERLEKLFSTAIGHYLEAKSLFCNAGFAFVSGAGLGDFRGRDSLFAIINSSEVRKVNRFDAEYFNAPCNKMLTQITKCKTAKLGDLVDMTKGVEPGAEKYQDAGTLFIRVSSISKDGIIDKDQKYLSDDLYNEYKADYRPQVGDILLTKDASPGVACVVREPVEGVISSGVMRLRLKEKMNPEYLALVLNSIVGRLQAERDAGGSIIAHWKPEQIKNLVVPILPSALQEKIADLITKSHQARTRAMELLEEAKSKVEEMIEKRRKG